MKQENLRTDVQEIRRYITEVIPLDYSRPLAGKKMEPGRRMQTKERRKAEFRNETHASEHSDQAVLIRYVEEEMVMMPDYSFDEKCMVRSVELTAVAVARKEKVIILRRIEGELQEPILY